MRRCLRQWSERPGEYSHSDWRGISHRDIHIGRENHKGHRHGDHRAHGMTRGHQAEATHAEQGYMTTRGVNSGRQGSSNMGVSAAAYQEVPVRRATE
eukprot:934398-Amphidinium_carterae.2